MTESDREEQKMKVVKFGGSSMADAGQYRKVRDILLADPERRVVVVSAAGKRFGNDHKLTDLLYLCYAHVQYGVDCSSIFDMIASRYLDIRDELGLDLALEPELEALKKRIDAKEVTQEELVSRGEYFSAKLMAAYLGFQFVDAADWVMFNMDGTVNREVSYKALRNQVLLGYGAVIPGFYGAMPDGAIHTFSRGGSDISGSIVARAAYAEMYENWTDVNGFLMADPHIVPNARPIRHITYRELRELSYMGATVLHEDSVFPVHRAGIPTNIRNTNAPEEIGTMITHGAVEEPNPYVITGIAGRLGFSVISVEKAMMNGEVGFGRKVLQAVEEFGLSFEHMPTGIDTMCVVLSTAELEPVKEQLTRRIWETTNPDTLTIHDNMGIIATVGRGMVHNPGTAARLFTALSRYHINVRMIDQGSSELSILVGVDSGEFQQAILAIYDEFVSE